MWKLIEISQQTCFINCNFTSKQEAIFTLYDLKETWCQTLSFQEVKQKVKQLNKRYDFNEDIIKETLLNGELETVTLEQQPHTSSTHQENCVIKLKYRVKYCPFNLEWSLRRQTLEEFQSTFMQPLFTALFGCYQQVEILSDILRKKDAELMQYRKEGAVLHRKTLTTKPFDFDEFDKKYQTSTKLAANYTELAKFVINTEPKVEHVDFTRAPETKKEETKIDIPPEKKSSSTNNTNAKMSPKQRKRKAQEIMQQQLERKLKVRKQQFEYESSQSQTTNSGYSQTNEETLKAEETKNKDSKVQKSPKKETKSDSDNHLTPLRRLTRCKPSKNYQENTSNDDETDSESDANNVRSFKDRTNVRREIGKLLKSDKTQQSVMSNNKNNETSNKEQILKSPVSSNSKSSQNLSHIFDFSTDSEYEPTLYEIKNYFKPSTNIKETRQTRSSPQVFTSIRDNEIVQSRKSSLCSTPTVDKSKNLIHIDTPNNDISAQLKAIQQELKILEAMRLADLQQSF